MGGLVEDGVVRVVDGAPALVGSRCTEVTCGEVGFPAAATCLRCGSTCEPTTLPRRGTLWTFTVQGFRPKSPPYAGAEFSPFGVGYVDLGEVIVEARLTESDPKRLHIGMEMELAVAPLADGCHTFAFGPVAR